MKCRQYINVLILYICIISCTDSKEVSEVNLETSLLETIDHFNHAFEKGNLSAIDTLVTENYINTNGHSKPIGKEDWFKYLRKRTLDLNSGDLEIISYEMTDTKIEITGNVAVVSGKIKVSSKTEQTIKNNIYSVTTIWIFENGLWKRAGFHDTKVM